ncbi:MAG: ABC transporter permease subunit [Actinomycetota bacterium]|nr:ABC transporter permease subunit [Actinomycetota bacterium]MDQ3628243.1 ABC transporter permease subunit [Actinomycetota bacterium]
MSAERRIGAAGPGRRAAVALVVGSTVVLVVLPIARLVQVVLREHAGDLDEVLTAPGLGTAVLNTVVLAVLVTVLAVPAGTLMALGLRRADLPGRGFWRVGVLLPVVVPEFVLAYSWTQAYGRAGFTSALFGLEWEGVLGPGGVLVVLVVNAVPLAYLLAAVGLAARDEPNLERAARACGASAVTVLRTVTLPLLRPPIAAASVLVFVLTLGTFAIPQVMGSPAGFATVTTRIYANLARGSDPFSFVEAVVLALLLVLLAGLVIAPADAVLGPRLRATRVAQPEGAPIVPVRRAASRWMAAGLGCYLLVAVALPLLALVAAALTRAVGLPPTPDNWTLDNVASVLDQRTVEAVGRSLGLAFLAATLLTVLGGCVAVLERGRSGRWLGTLITLTLVLPGSTLAVALLITYGRWLGGTLTLVLLAYLAKLWAFAHRPISGALDRLPPQEMHAARASGADWLTAVRTVALRPLAPALLCAWLVCFLIALHEVTMSSLLYGPGSETLAVVVLNSQELGQIGQTAALAVLLTVAMAVPALLLWLTLRWLRAPQRASRHPQRAPARTSGGSAHA